VTLSSDAQQYLRKVDDVIDEATAPHNMKPEEAIEFLEEISTNIDGKIEAVREENSLPENGK
jgi:hypothetical protein